MRFGEITNSNRCSVVSFSSSSGELSSFLYVTCFMPTPSPWHKKGHSTEDTNSDFHTHTLTHSHVHTHTDTGTDTHTHTHSPRELESKVP